MSKRLKILWKALPPSLRERGLLWMSSFRLGPPWRPQDRSDTPTFVLGFFCRGSGLGESARLWYEAESCRNNQVHAVDVTSYFKKPETNLTESEWLSIKDLKRHVGPARLVLHLNPPHFIIVLTILGRKFLEGKEIVAYWAWELEDVPPLWLFALRYTHGVEVPSTFVAEAIQRHTENPVSVVPHPVIERSRRTCGFAEDGITRVLFVFDMESRMLRKNPQAAIDAFRIAFGDRLDVQLTLKVSNMDSDPASSELLRRYVGSAPNIRILGGTIPPDAMSRLYQHNDIYLSLHRSEGYGLTIREAMRHGMHVVATGWSGNMDFMYGEKVWPVAYTLVPVPKNQDYHGLETCRWAEADVEQAAAIMQEIDRTERSKIRAYTNTQLHE